MLPKIVKLTFLLTGLSFILFQSCKKDENTTNDTTNNSSTSTNKIMPLGASRVQGNRPDYESFRYELWKDLTAAGWDFDFIGNMQDNASYPTFQNLTFDNDHEGRGGWTSGEILDGLEDWLDQTGPVDIVLFSSPAGNDALQGLPYNQAIVNINGIIDVLQADNPNVTIVIEQMAPGHSSIMTQNLTNLLDQLKLDLVTISSDQTTPTSSVILVDMFTGFTDAMLADDVHYNEIGAEFIATRYFNVLSPILQD